MRRPNRIQREGPLEVVGMVWGRDRITGRWVTYLVRRFKNSPYDRNKATVFGRLTYVDADDEFCPACLSQMISHVLGHAPWRQCDACGIRFYFEPAPRKR